jgi:general secretion pathway protein I
MMMTRSDLLRDRGQGFTLVEVMVALAIVAIALPALMFTLFQQVDGTAYLRDKSQAQLVAINKLTEIRILAKASGNLLNGNESGQAEMADRQWYWWVNSTATEVPEFYRLAISVGLDEEQPDKTLHTLVAYLSADLRSEEEGDGGG